MHVVITGASAGIGAAAARRFAKEGYFVILLARRKEKLEALREELGGKRAAVFELDVTSSDQVAEVFQRIEKEIGPIDILVNNAGAAFGVDLAQEARLEEWEKCVDVNVKGLISCVHAVLPSMVRRNRGQIINLGSIAAHYPYPGGNVYAATKAFVHQFSLSLRADLKGTRVRVNCIEPGLTGGTEFSIVRFRGDAKRAENLYSDTDCLTPEDIAETIYFCASLPSHVNINMIELMPVSQSFASLPVHKSANV